MNALYGLELVNPAGLLLADVSAFARSRSWSRTRNNSDTVDFTLPLDQFEAYCAKLGVHPRSILKYNWTEARIKRGEKYLASGRVVYLKTSLSARTIDVRCTGILDALKKRRTAELREFFATEATLILWTAIQETQAKPHGDLGITLGPVQATVGPHDRTYKRTVLKDLAQNLTTVQTNPFDFDITYDKKLNTYVKIGSYRSDIIFQWGTNIIDATVTEDSVDLVNDVVGIGSGFGTDGAVTVNATDETSKAEYGLAEDVITSNASDNSDGGLTADTGSYISSWSRGVTLLDIVVNGALRPYVTDYGIGDVVKIDLTGHPWLDGVVGMFRIHQMRGPVGDDNTEPITLTVSI